MATGPQFTVGLAPVLGFSEFTLDRYMRELRAAGITRKSGKGGGKVGVHLNSEEDAAIVLSSAASQPSDAVDAVIKLGNLWDENPRAGNSALSLLHVLGLHIEERARQILRGIPGGPSRNPQIWELILCLLPLSAAMTWYDREGAVIHIKQFGDPQKNLPQLKHPQESYSGARRLTIITEAVLEKAAELLANSLAHTGASFESAGDPGRSPAPVPARAALATPEASAAPTLRGRQPPRNRSKP